MVLAFILDMSSLGLAHVLTIPGLTHSGLGLVNTTVFTTRECSVVLFSVACACVSVRLFALYFRKR